jgi:hypothetical protein
MLTQQVTFQPLIGQLVWSVRKGHDTFLTMEFGEPHLDVVEPTETHADVPEETRRRLARRHVHLCGDWHFWLQHCHWLVTTHYCKAGSEDFSGEMLMAALQELDGQRLVSVEHGEIPSSTILKFDMGGQIVIWPVGYAEPDDDQWSLHEFQGGIVSFNCEGELITEERVDL